MAIKVLLYSLHAVFSSGVMVDTLCVMKKKQWYQNI